MERDETDRLSLAKSIQSDFAPLDGYIKTIRFAPDGHTMLTCGNDDHIRLWHFPWLGPTDEFKLPKGNVTGSKDEKLEDADFDRDGIMMAIVTPSALHIRMIKEDKFVAVLAPSSGYMFRCARFIKRGKQSFLVTVENSKGSGKPVLCLWSCNSWIRYSQVRLYTRLRVTSMAVSANHRLIAIGAADGTVIVYDNRLYVIFGLRDHALVLICL